MLLSMTGYGRARTQTDAQSVSVEVRTVNNRYLKFSFKCPDSLAPRESAIEKVVREYVERGTVQLTIRLDRAGRSNQYAIDEDVLQSYWKQLESLHSQAGITLPHDAAALLALPGVVVEQMDDGSTADSLWPVLVETLKSALDQHREFRIAEGRSMESDLRAQLQQISSGLGQISEIAPDVVREYRDRILERVGELLRDSDATVNANDVIRDVSVFADRCDINEEITRLRSHIEQFEKFIQADTSSGRKLEFVGQEMFREVNTIGSKANNIEISHRVVEMKAAIEKIREILQNAE